MAPAILYDNYDKSYLPNEDLITVSEYIYRRILQMDIKSIFGVPGDFVLDFCEEISKTPELNWVGTCNELNGSYAADGYGKISGKIGVFVSTFGVGELSALNGISGAFLEYTPLLHIVGTSSRLQKLDKRSYHHLIQKANSKVPDHYVYEQIIKPISIVQESLFELERATEQIDNAIEQVYLNSRPGYIFLPSDMATCYVSSSSLYKPLNLQQRDNNPELTSKIATKILEKLYNSTKPAVIVDYLVRPFRQQAMVNELISKLQDKVNLFTMAMSKSYIDESHPRFVGVYAGNQTPFQQTRDIIEDSDFVLDIGSFDVQTNNGAFTCKYSAGSLIELNEYMVTLADEVYELNFIHILLKLVELIEPHRIPVCEMFSKAEYKHKQYNLNDNLTQNFLATSLENFLRPNDILVVETCSFLFTVPDLRIPDKFRILTQNFYNSIGYALPATIGASLANKELGYEEKESRLILIQGDGSLLMTLQELTTYMRQDIKLMILLLNNDGYTVERVILGEKSLYNDIPANIQWTKLFNALGDVGNRTVNTTIKTNLELQKHLKTKEFANGSKLQMVELMLDRMDAPDRFKQMIGHKI